MYAILCFFFISAVWSVFLYRILVNIRRENEIKRNNQAYYNSKIVKLKNKVYETRRRTKGTEEAEGKQAEA